MANKCRYNSRQNTWRLSNLKFSRNLPKFSYSLMSVSHQLSRKTKLLSWTKYGVQPILHQPQNSEEKKIRWRIGWSPKTVWRVSNISRAVRAHLHLTKNLPLKLRRTLDEEVFFAGKECLTSILNHFNLFCESKSTSLKFHRKNEFRRKKLNQN